MIKRWGLVAGICLASACGGAQPAAPRTFARNVPDVAARNLPPEEELDALLSGLPAVGRATAATRVAVAPFKMLGPPADAWVGEAASEIVAARLASLEGVSVLGPGELVRLDGEVRRPGEEIDRARAVAIGRAVGARYLVLGKLVPAGAEEWTLVAHVASVETGEWVKAVEVPIRRADLPGSAGAAATALGAAVGSGNASAETAPDAAVKPLGPKELEIAARARELQYLGDLAGAQPLYAQALAAPSTAWRFEADYVRVLMDLGLQAAGGSRGRAVLARMPVSPATVCDRALLELEVIREKYGVEEAREAVRTAASCGDPSVTALALRHYASAMEDIHYPTSAAALARAQAIITPTSDRWAACWIDWHRYIRQVDAGDWSGRRDERLAPIAAECEDGGNERVRAKVLRLAGSWAVEPQRRLELLQAAEKAAATAGGQVVDEVARAMADELRARGQPAAADDRLLGALGIRLRALQELYGGLPRPLDRLDAELLRRAGVRAPKAAASEPREPLLAQAHRAAAADLLRAWAERTEAESKGQASFYAALADELAPPSDVAPAGETPDARLERKLAAAGLPLATLKAAAEAPLRGSAARPLEAFYALQSWLSYSPSTDEARRAEAKAALRKVADWVDQPWVHRNLDMDEARALEAKGLHQEALAAARATLKYAPDSPTWSDTELAFEAAVLKITHPQAMAEVGARRIAAARKVSGGAQVEAVYRLAYDGLDTRTVEGREAVHALTVAAADLAARDDAEAAAEALRLAGTLANLAESRTGTTDDIELCQKRVELLDRLRDPVRSLDARIAVLEAVRRYYSSGFPRHAKDYVAEDPIVLASMPEVRRRLEELVRAGRERDAARLVARIPAGSAGLPELAEAALGWSEHFRDSVEYPLIAARIWSQRSLLETDRAKRLAATKAARDLFMKAGAFPSAVVEARSLIAAADTEAELWAALDACFEVAKADPTQPDLCVGGAANAIYKMGPSRIEDLGRVKKLAERGRELIPSADLAQEPKYRIDYRSSLAGLFALAGDRDATAAFDGEVRRYAESTPSYAFALGQHLEMMAEMTAPRDARRALALAKEFEAKHLAAAVWRAGAYATFALIAHEAGDAGAAASFEKQGRESAVQADLEVLPYYDLNMARLAIRKKDWRGAAKGYEQAAATVRKRLRENPHWAAELDLFAAMASLYGRDGAGADALLGPAVRASERRLAAGAKAETPCLDADLATLAASSRMAAGQCAEGERLRAVASRLQALCTGETCFPTTDAGTWCDRAGSILKEPVANQCRQPVAIQVQNLGYR